MKEVNFTIGDLQSLVFGLRMLQADIENDKNISQYDQKLLERYKELEKSITELSSSPTNKEFKLTAV